VGSYRLVIKPSAAKELEAISNKRDRQRIVTRIRSLAANPRPLGCEKLAGRGERFRVRQGRYRVVYEIEDAPALVRIVKVGHRKDVYR
jgi:mRNA interferase RelE/StbE